VNAGVFVPPIWQAGTNRSDHMELPARSGDESERRVFRQVEAVTVLRSRLPSEKICGTRENENGSFVAVQSIVVLFLGGIIQNFHAKFNISHCTVRS
jgi:hypothetical protein